MSGRVLDATTGQPIGPGGAKVTVFGRAEWIDTFAPLLASGAVGPDGRFSLSGYDGVADKLYVKATGSIPYPVPDLGEARPVQLLSTSAYFGSNVDVRGARVGAVGLHPTCLTIGSIHLSRSLDADERIRLSMGVPADVSRVSSLSALHRTATVTRAAAEALASLPLLSFGDRQARLSWRVVDANEVVVSSGAVALPTCPRHGVLDYEATLALK